MMLIPARALVASVWLLLAGAVAASVWAGAYPYWLGLAGALLLLALADGLLVLRAVPPEVTRRVAHALALGSERPIELCVTNPGARRARLVLFDHAPPDFACTELPLALDVPPASEAVQRYSVRPLSRGDHAFGGCEMRVGSPLGLWQRRVLAGQPSRVKVYPNFQAVTRYALLATDHRLSQIGVLKRRRRGVGLEFQNLREYREGDAQRQVDWKASSRMGRLISREYQDERDQQIVLLLDCGRRMAAQDDALSHLDHVLNAALLLAYVGLRQGDAVGLATLAGAPRWFAPRKSLATVNALLNQVYALEPTLQAPDFYQAAVDLMVRMRKRALVVILTNLRDEDEDTLMPALALLRQRHLVMVASLRETILGDALRRPVGNLDDALTHAATAEYLERRRAAFKRLENERVPCLDVEPAGLPIALVNRYLELKRSGRM
jgi:uncharacterized protein (DUF58 family)